LALEPRTLRRVLHPCFALLSFLDISACGGDAAAVPRPEVLDSAGVRVVLNPAPHPEDDPRWTVRAQPEVEVGVLEGAPEDQLFDVSDALVLADGVMVVANRGTHELRFYDRTGRHLRSTGGEGDGPGEFRSLRFVDRFADDSLLAFDARHLRASVFDRDGRFVRSFPLREPTSSPYPDLAGALSSGAIVVRENHPYIAGVAPTGADRSPARLLLGSSTGLERDTLGVFPGDETFVMAVPADMWITVRPMTFGRSLLVKVAGDRIAVGTTDDFAIRIYGPDGVLREIIRQRRVPVPVEMSDVARFNDSLLATVEHEVSRRHYREMFELMPRHETFPAFARVHLDRAGNLWVQEYSRPGDERSVWQVFDQEGVFAARVEVPWGLQVLDIGEEHILGVVRDEVEVERLRLYGLDKLRG